MVQLPITPGAVTLSDAERESGKWSPANLQRALELLHRDGVVVLNNTVPVADLEKLRDSMMPTAKKIKNQKLDLEQFNHGVASNFLQSPPLSDPALQFPTVYTNPFVISFAEHYLGPGLQTPFCTANVACAETGVRQPVHKDASYRHPEARWGMVANFLLSDFVPANGSTEFWLGTHVNTGQRDQMWATTDADAPTCDIKPESLEARRAVRAPSQVDVKFGSVVLRDMCVWHAGMPNPSADDRIMIAVPYFPSWFPLGQKFKAPESVRPLFSSIAPRVTYHCEYFLSAPMKIAYAGVARGSEWKTVGDIPDDEKVLNPRFQGNHGVKY
ncbi:hypothetical protein BD626DRAFT_548456 [Schizophyllum amplum]|uniref:Phytanoyl-CoA dioxygenase n=1 Tax=Schizophyllum amplum TaxID=97359 RepID=A0A550CCR4_9AGAR|nr:hypothetical protein BD626DRAFT_548456 [Auriculariopsis ampla]